MKMTSVSGNKEYNGGENLDNCTCAIWGNMDLQNNSISLWLHFTKSKG